MHEIRLTLPWPPSVNHYWRNFRGRMVIGAKGRAYRHAVIASVIEQGIPRDRISCRLAVSIDAYPPDNRRRDIDNINKALLDAELTDCQSESHPQGALGACFALV